MAGRKKQTKTPAVPARRAAARVSRGRTHPGGASFPVSPGRSELPRDYAKTLGEIKQRIRQERLRVVLAANSAMVLLYWDIGRMILDRQERAGWGARVIDRLAADLREAFPDMKGFSPRNLKYMRAFAAAWRDPAIVQQLAAQIPWFHNCLLLERVPDPAARNWYIHQVVEHGWSRNILALQIDTRAHARHGKAITNFKATLPPADSDLAAQVFKDPYLFDFLALPQNLWVERAGNGAAKGRTPAPGAPAEALRLGGRRSRIWWREHRGRGQTQSPVSTARGAVFGMPGTHRFYAGADFLGTADPRPEREIEKGLRHPDDKPTIGLLLCRSKDRIVVVLDFRPPQGYISDIYSLSDQPSGLRQGFVFWGQASRPVPSGGYGHAA